MKAGFDRRVFLLVLLILITFGCGGGSGGGSETAGPGSDPGDDSDLPSSTEMAEVLREIEALEESGAVPKLDRSTDIVGPDVDANGIRDDIEVFISALDISSSQKQAASQVAQAFQMTLTADLDDTSELAATALENLNALNCLATRAPQAWPELLDALEAVTANTKERTLRYIEYNVAQSGTISRLPVGDTCKNI